MNVIVSWVLVTLLIISGISLVILTATPALDRSKDALELQLAESSLKELLRLLNEVASEGNGSSRTVSIPEGEWSLQNNTISYRISTDLMESGTREIGKIEKISGSDASCKQEDNFVMENAILRISLKRQNGEIASSGILEIHNKATGTAIRPEDSSIIIDGIEGTKTGTGFSMIEESSGAKCTIRYHIDSNAGIAYDVFYTLYAGADFLVVEVENVR